MDKKKTFQAADVYDFVIIGSGFGGSVSAYRLAEKGYSVLVLERGKRFNSEDFPKSNLNIFNSMWMPSIRCFGIFRLVFFKDLWLGSGAGVGGGSLVYASTHIKPPKAFFEGPEWCDLADWETELEPYYDVANRMLGTSENPCFWPADHQLYEIAKELGTEETFKPTPVGIFFGEPGVTVADPYFDGMGPSRTGCIHCGGCMVGCRHNAKNTLDKNYLYLAEKLGAQVWPEQNVLDIRPLYGPQTGAARYEIEIEKITDWFFKRRGTVHARNVVVSGGVLGTVDLLLKCRDETQSLPFLSRRLGYNVRTNSEAVMGVTARESDIDYSQGVAISSHIWVDNETSVEPVRYPPKSSLLRHVTIPLIPLNGGVWQRIGEVIKYAFNRPRDFLGVKILSKWPERNTVLLVMQTADNLMHLRRGRSIMTLFRRGLITEPDEENPILCVVESGREIVERFAKRVNGVPWEGMNDVLDNPNTAHILGGCGIGADETDGVIDINHQVFNYPGMYVADASAIPSNLGVNPSLTIAAMTERAMSRIPAKKVAGPVKPLQRPAGLDMIQQTENRRSLLLKAAPFAVLLALLPIVFGAFQLLRKKK
ncbi:MAG: GMC oxidoreductase [Candidatus Promineifilaceae bacterium]|jgi:cholesterol oxidase